MASQPHHTSVPLQLVLPLSTATSAVSTTMQLPSTPPSSEPPRLDADFLHRLSCPPDTHDLDYAHSRRALQAALRMPSANRWIADWLFLDSDRYFHKHIQLAPDSFTGAHAMNIRHDFITDSPETTSAMQNLRCGHAVSQSARSAPARNGSLTKDVDLLLVPAANKDALTVGYAFMNGTFNSNGKCNYTSSYFGRFAYNRNDKDLLMITNGLPVSMAGSGAGVEVTALMTVNWNEENKRRQHSFFMLPKDEYSFHNLPSTVLSVCTAFDFNARSTSHDAPPDFSDIFSDSLSQDAAEKLMGDLFQEASSQCREPSHSGMLDAIIDGMDTEIDALTQLVPQAHRRVQFADLPEPSTGAYNMSSLADSLLGIETSLTGDFYGSRIQQAFTPPNSGLPELYGSVITKIDPANLNVTNRLQQMAAAKYYSSTVSVSTDQPLLIASAAAEDSPASLPSYVTCVESNQSASSAAGGDVGAKLAPRPTGEVKPDVEDEEAILERRREEKRRRNRMSAARSNEKRKKKWDLQKKTLKDLQSQVEQLTQRKQVLLWENKKLKGQILLT